MLVVHMSYEPFSSTGNYPDTMVLEGESWLLYTGLPHVGTIDFVGWIIL